MAEQDRAIRDEWLYLGASADFYDRKAGAYEEFQNLELLRVVQETLPRGGRILDVGCASGGLLAHLEPLAGFRAGIELSREAADAAGRIADHVVCGGIDDDSIDFPPGSFDVVVCADVLEHLSDPAAALRRVVGWTAPGGAVVVSVPNIANLQSRLRLLRGVWRYEACGIWDSGHLRFFNLDSLRALLGDAGLQVESVAATVALELQIPRVVRHLPKPAVVWIERAAKALARLRPQVFGVQLICVGRKVA